MLIELDRVKARDRTVNVESFAERPIAGGQ